MVATLVLALTLTVQDPSERHIRATDARIASLIETGLSESATFRRLVTILNDSDVIVHVEPKQMRNMLGGYLAHNIVAGGGYRYLRIAVETQGSRRRLVALLAHELQHAVEVAQAPAARDAVSLERTFSQLAVAYGCGSTTCYETQAAKDLEYIVSAEIAAFRKR